MKITKEQIKQIRKLVKEGRTRKEISIKLNINYRRVCYYGNEQARKKCLERAKIYQKENKLNRDQKNYRKYQNKYHKSKYESDPKYREYIKEKNRENQRIRYNKLKEV